MGHAEEVGHKTRKEVLVLVTVNVTLSLREIVVLTATVVVVVQVTVSTGIICSTAGPQSLGISVQKTLMIGRLLLIGGQVTSNAVRVLVTVTSTLRYTVIVPVHTCVVVQKTVVTAGVQSFPALIVSASAQQSCRKRLAMRAKKAIGNI